MSCLALVMLGMVIMVQPLYSQQQGGAKPLLFPFLPDFRGEVASTKTHLSQHVASADQLRQPSLLGMTPIYRTLPFQLAWNGQGGVSEAGDNADVGIGHETHEEIGPNQQSAHALQMIRQLQVGDTAGDRDKEHLTVGQMMKLLSSIGNRMKHP